MGAYGATATTTIRLGEWCPPATATTATTAATAIRPGLNEVLIDSTSGAAGQGSEQLSVKFRAMPCQTALCSNWNSVECNYTAQM